jgi:hypothetical protein
MQRKTCSKDTNALISSEVMLLAEIQARSSKGSSNDSDALPRRSAPQRIRPNSFPLPDFPIILLADGVYLATIRLVRSLLSALYN